MIRVKKARFYQFSLLLVVVMVFLIGGALQFFLGLSNTLYSYAILAFLLGIYALYAYNRGAVYWDKVIAWLLAFGAWILISAAINGTEFAKTSIYLLFCLLPLSVYLFFKINQKRDYFSGKSLSRLYLGIALLQLPLLLIQRFGYGFLIGFNRSSQSIASEDFMFGSLFVKADHALGFFLLLNIFNLLENNKKYGIIKAPWLVMAYLGVTILISESNISKLMLLVLIVFLVYRSFPKKIRLVSLVIALATAGVLATQALKMEKVQTQLYFIENQYNPEKSWENFQKGIAKRPQVVIAYAAVLPFKWVGDGPYSYFNILTGEFTMAKHFSQFIWTYADLGVIGVVLLIFLLYHLAASLRTSRFVFLFVFGMILIYAFMTTIFSDLAIMITLTSLLQSRKS